MNVASELYILGYLLYIQCRLILPYWLIGVAAGSAISVFASSWIEKTVVGLKNERMKFAGILFASLLGVISPICMYGTIPFIASLGKRGIPQYFLSAFMVSSVLLNPNLFMFSFLLGTPIALLRLLISLLAGVAAGGITLLFFKSEKLFDYKGFEERKKREYTIHRFFVYLHDMKRGLVKTAPYFVIGIVLTALFDRYFPKHFLTDLFGSNNGLGVLFATALGVPVYVCGGGTIPLLKAWMDIGMTPGAAVAFMVSGPATKLTNLSAVKMILNVKSFVLYFVFSIAFAIISGLITDILIK